VSYSISMSFFKIQTTAENFGIPVYGAVNRGNHFQVEQGTPLTSLQHGDLLSIKGLNGKPKRAFINGAPVDGIVADVLIPPVGKVFIEKDNLPLTGFSI
jgi:hypothetical protein